MIYHSYVAVDLPAEVWGGAYPPKPPGLKLAPRPPKAWTAHTFSSQLKAHTIGVHAQATLVYSAPP